MWSVCRNDVAEVLTMVCSSLSWAFCRSSAKTHLPTGAREVDSIAN